MRIKGIAWFAFMVSVATLFSCAKEEQKTIMASQESEIEKYVKTLTGKRVEVNDGIWRVVIEEGTLEERSVKPGDSLWFDYAAYIFSSGKGTLFDTNIYEIAKLSGAQLDFDYLVTRREIVGKGKLIAGLDRGVVGAKKGERCYVIFSARHGFGNTQIGLVPKMSPIILEVWVKDIK